MYLKKLLILAGVLVVILFAYFIFKGNNSTSIYNNQPNITSTPSATTSGAIQSQIEIKNFSFNPSSTTVKTGTTVTWINNDSVPHTIVSDPDGSVFKSQTLQPGEKFEFTFANAGTFPYHCSIHPSMQSSVTVTP